MDYRHDLFRWQREKLGDTYDQIAGRCGLSKNTVYLIIEGKTNPTVSSINQISDALYLHPKFALDRDLRERQFRRARVATAR
jgi:transcriptional regulator with XRE-family HTH domain